MSCCPVQNIFTYISNTVGCRSMTHRWTFCGGVYEDHPQEVQQGVWREEDSAVLVSPHYKTWGQYLSHPFTKLVLPEGEPRCSCSCLFAKINFVKDVQNYLSLATLFLSLSAFTQVLLSTPPSLTLLFYFIYTKNNIYLLRPLTPFYVLCSNFVSFCSLKKIFTYK